MPRRTTSSPHANRQKLERAAEHYLAYCYKTRTAARAEEFARYLRVSPQYLSRRVPEIAGMSVTAFLRERQLAYAERLLRNPTLRVREIAVLSGFGTLWTFHRWFRAAYGMTPGRYREKVMK